MRYFIKNNNNTSSSPPLKSRPPNRQGTYCYTHYDQAECQNIFYSYTQNQK